MRLRAGIDVCHCDPFPGHGFYRKAPLCPVPDFDYGSDVGTIDCVTQEILHQVNENKVILAWILDSSGSLQERRQAITDRLDRIYHELEELDVNKHDAVLTVVVAVGERTQFLLEKPTADPGKIRNAYRNLVDDGTGVENLFTAMRQTLEKLHRFKTATQRTLMFVVVTDEAGDDVEKAEDTAGMLRHYKVPVCVLGPTASFGPPVLHDQWQDPKTGFCFAIPIERGLYTRRQEVLRVPFADTPYRSGFGPLP